MLFDDIKVGDVVILQTPYRSTIEKVTSVAKTIFCAGGIRFRKDDGWQYGGDKYTSVLVRRGTNEEIKKEMTVRENSPLRFTSSKNDNLIRKSRW